MKTSTKMTAAGASLLTTLAVGVGLLVASPSPSTVRVAPTSAEAPTAPALAPEAAPEAPTAPSTTQVAPTATTVTTAPQSTAPARTLPTRPQAPVVLAQPSGSTPSTVWSPPSTTATTAAPATTPEPLICRRVAQSVASFNRAEPNPQADAQFRSQYQVWASAWSSYGCSTPLPIPAR